MSSIVGLSSEGSNNNLGSEQMNYADHNNELLSFSVLKRLDKQFQDIMLAIDQVWGRKLVEMESRIMQLESAVDKLLVSMKSNNSSQRCLNLNFINKISSPIWTGDEIKGEGGSYIQIVLVDETGMVVHFGQEASAEVKISAFKLDVDDSEGNAVKIGHITDDVARDDKAKRSILTGDVRLKLNNGTGILANIKFRSSSSHTSGVFKLRAQVVDCFDDTVIKDAKTESFIVKDYRGKYNGKHHPPILSDDTCHLDNIGKGRSMRLKGLAINTVEKFLIKLLIDSDGLKHVVGLRGKEWDATVKHALTCQLDEKVYCSIDSEGNNGVVFNVVGKVLGLILESKYVPLDNLSDKAKADASKMDIAKIVQKGRLVVSDDEASLLQQFPQEHEGSKVGESCQTNIIISAEDVTSSSNFTAGTSSLNLFGLEDAHPGTDDFRDTPMIFSDQECYDIESLWTDYNTGQNTSIDGMVVESSPVVPDNEVKKKLFMLYTISKWLLELEKMAACDGNGNKKRRRIETN